MEIQDIEFVECKICKIKKKSLTSHIRKEHNLTKEEYLHLYPNSRLNSISSSEKRSNAIKNNWKDPSYVNSHSESSKRMWKNEDFKNNMSNIASANMSNNWKNSEFRENVSSAARNTITNRWNNDEGYRDWETDRKSTRLNSSHITRSRMPSSA